MNAGQQDSSTPLVSVIVPAYNRARFVRQAVQSALAATSAATEVIVIDDGSTDDTRGIVGSIGDDRVRLVAQTNAGRAAARNNGAALASSRWLLFLDSDDLRYVGSVDAQLHAAARVPDCAIVGAGYDFLDESGGLLHRVAPWMWHQNPGDFRSTLEHCSLQLGATLIRRSHFEALGGFDTDRAIEGAEDWDLWIRSAAEGGRAEWFTQMVYGYRLHADNSVRRVHQQAAARLAVVDKVLASRAASHLSATTRARVRATSLLYNSGLRYGSGSVVAAAADLESAAAADPTVLATPEQFVKLVTDWAGNPVITDHPLRFVNRVYSTLPSALSDLATTMPEARRRARWLQLSIARERGDRDGVWRGIARLVGAEPRLLLNRGVLSTAVRSLARVRGVESRACPQ